MRLRIRAIRLAKGMTLKELGDRIGRKAHSVWEYENHKTRVSAELLYAIAQALEVTVDELFEPDDADALSTNGHPAAVASEVAP